MNALFRIREKIGSFDENVPLRFAAEAVSQLMSFLTGALLSSVNGFGVLSPFGTAFAAAADGRYLISSCFGAAAGSILSHDSLSALRYICALLCSAVAVTLLRQFDRFRQSRLTGAAAAGFSLLLTGITVLAAQGFGLNSLSVVIGEACIGFAAGYIYTSAREAIRGFFTEGKKPDGVQLQLTAVAAATLLLGLSEITLFSVSFARIITVFLLLTVSRLLHGGEAVFAAAGLVFTLDPAAGSAALIYAAAGLTLSFMPKSGKLLRAGLFVTAYTVMYVFIIASGDKLYLLAEVIAGAAVFAVIPDRAYTRLGSRITAQEESVNALSARRAVITRLERAADAVAQVGDSVGAAAKLMNREEDGDLGLYALVRDDVCADCPQFGLCWTKNFSACRLAFDAMNETLKNNGRLSRDKLPVFLNGCCVKKAELTYGFTHRYLEVRADRSRSSQIDRLRRLTCEQLGCVNALLSEMSCELAAPISVDERLSSEISVMLKEKFSLKVRSAVCTGRSDGRVKIEIVFRSKPDRLSVKELTDALEAVCSVRLSPPAVNTLENGVSVTFTQRTRYRVEAAASRLSADTRGLCGDSYEGFGDTDGNYYAVLSDGMGTGVRAAIDSSLAVSVASRLLKAGFSCEGAARLVNCALLLRSSEESFATLDVIKIDLFTGKAVFCKAGACRSLVKRKGRMTEIDSASMPLGILSDTDLAVQSVNLKTGDLVMMTSDGAYEYCDDAVKKAFFTSRDESAASITQRILTEASRARDSKGNDDVTAIVIRLLDN